MTFTYRTRDKINVLSFLVFAAYCMGVFRVRTGHRYMTRGYGEDTSPSIYLLKEISFHCLRVSLPSRPFLSLCLFPFLPLSHPSTFLPLPLFLQQCGYRLLVLQCLAFSNSLSYCWDIREWQFLGLIVNRRLLVTSLTQNICEILHRMCCQCYWCIDDTDMT